MKHAARALVAGLFALVLAPVPEAVAAARCADVFPALSLGRLPAEAETAPFFYSSEGTSTGRFRVFYSGFDCGQSFLHRLSSTYGASDGSATEPADYQLNDGSPTGDLCGTPTDGCPNEREFTFNIMTSTAEEAALESFTLTLDQPPFGNLIPPSSVPYFIVDDDGLAPRVTFDGLPYDRSESHPVITIPVWKAGPGPTTVNYSFSAAAEAGAVEGEDFTVTSPRPLVFGATEVVKTITLAINNDGLMEPTETLNVNLSAPSAGSIEGSASKAVSISDNEEGQAPSSRFHHPRHGWRYKKSDFRIRETHVFATDAGVAGVTGVQWALRRNRMNGSCQWLTTSGWVAKDCQNRQWLDMKFALKDPSWDLYIYGVQQLKSSVGTKIKNYTAFSRAVDGAGNMESQFSAKRNANTFEVKRSRHR